MALWSSHFLASWEEDRMSSWGGWGEETTFTFEFRWGLRTFQVGLGSPAPELAGEDEGLMVNPVLAHLNCYNRNTIYWGWVVLINNKN